MAAARRVVLKLGTRVVTHPDGRVALPRIFSVVETAARLREQGRQVLIVSSGAVGLGVEALGFGRMPADLMERQACAAVGQTRLMGLYEEGFQRLGLVCGQVLLTRGDFEDRVRYLNLRSTLQTLLRRGSIPVINENDAVSTEELAFVDEGRRHAFGDNDGLSALVAAKLDADLLVLLTDVDGVFDRDPRQHPDARLVERIDVAEERGGRLGAARLGGRPRRHAPQARGRPDGGAGRLPRGDRLGRRARRPRRGARRRRGRHLVPGRQGARRPAALDRLRRGHQGAAWSSTTGAVRALRERKASLLAAGVRRVEGDFRTGDVVELRGPGGEPVGRGIAFWDAAVTRAWCAGEPPAGIRNHDALIDRDNMILEG